MENMDSYLFYKVSMESERGSMIQMMIDVVKSCAKAADKLTLELGAESRTESPNSVVPSMGIGSLIFTKPQSQKKYKWIGRRGKKNEYIPNMNDEKGKSIATRIAKLPSIGSAELIASFGLPKDATLSPCWFIAEEVAYLKCKYPLGDDYTLISEEEFEKAKGVVS